MATDEPTVSQDEDDACEVEQGESEKVQPDPDLAGAMQPGWYHLILRPESRAKKDSNKDSTISVVMSLRTGFLHGGGDVTVNFVTINI